MLKFNCLNLYFRQINILQWVRSLRKGLQNPLNDCITHRRTLAHVSVLLPAATCNNGSLQMSSQKSIPAHFYQLLELTSEIKSICSPCSRVLHMRNGKKVSQDFIPHTSLRLIYHHAGKNIFSHSYPPKFTWHIHKGDKGNLNKFQNTDLEEKNARLWFISRKGVLKWFYCGLCGFLLGFVLSEVFFSSLLFFWGCKQEMRKAMW